MPHASVNKDNIKQKVESNPIFFNPNLFNIPQDHVYINK